MPAQSKQQLIVETAFALFKRNGFYATGVDLIMREAGVSKRTLYKYYPTKNELIVAVLEHYRATYQLHLNTLIDTPEKSARDKIHAIFLDAMTWFDDINFHGCLAVNAMGEFAAKEQSIERACLQFKQWEIGVLNELCREINTPEPEKLAYQLFALLEGMSAIAQVNPGPCPVDMPALADDMIDRHIQNLNQ